MLNFSAWLLLSKTCKPFFTPLFTQIFNYHLQKMDEWGLLHKYTRLGSKPTVVGGGTSATPLGYENVFFPFIGVIVGTVIALSTLFCEMIVAGIEGFYTQNGK